MKYKIIIMGFLLVIMSMFTLALDIEAPAINVTLMNQDPDPVNPGNYVDVRFKINNDGANAVAENFQVKIEPVYPFSLDSNEKALRDIGDLPALGDYGNLIVVKYKLRVAEDAVEGTNKIKLKYKYNNLPWMTEEFDLDVQTVDANLAIVMVETFPERVQPGDEAVLKIKVKNMADSTMKDITLKLDLTFSDLVGDATATTAADSITAFNTLPFAPLGSATEQKIYMLEPGEENIFSYNLIAYSDAESGVYKIPIELTYYDELETSYLKEDIVGVIVGTKPDMSVVLDETELYVGKQSGTVTIRFINKGFSAVKFLDVKLEDNGEYDVISANEVYVGNVDSDDYETAHFNIYLKNGATKKEKTITLPLKVEYRDANNNLYSETHNLELDVLKPEKLGIKQSSGGGFIFVILLIIGGVIYYRRRKKKSKK